MFDIFNTDTYLEAPDGLITLNNERLYKNFDKKEPITVKQVTELILELEHFFKQKNSNFKISKQGIEDFLNRLYLLNSENRIKKDWISTDIKLMVDLEGNTLSRKLQGRIQVIQDSNFKMLKTFSEEKKKNVKDIFILCLRKREPKYRIRQEFFTNIGSDLYDFVDYELSVADSIAYIYDEIYNSIPGEKIYFKRFEEQGCCSKCKKLNNKVVLWSNVPLDSNEINDKYSRYAIWDDRFTEKKSKIPLTWCCNDCRGSWIRYYPDV